MDLIQKIQDQKKALNYLLTVLLILILLNISKAKEPFDKVDVWQGKVDKIDVYTDQDILQNY